jgi:hypothetical protein
MLNSPLSILRMIWCAVVQTRTVEMSCSSRSRLVDGESSYFSGVKPIEAESERKIQTGRKRSKDKHR